MLASLCLAAACDSGGSGDEAAADGTTTESAPFDEAEVIARAGEFATALEKINAEPFASQHGLADMVNVYVNPEAEALYRTLDPAAPAELEFPEGTLIVKEHLDSEGAFDGYLLMYRGPEGYDDAGGDWFWARVDGAGATQETGSVGFCISCHEPVPSFVFGVEPDNQG